jgi:hypothetical protein
MKWAFELLNLPLETDAASIKRAYARLLRNTRPDENPEAFQRLHAAYKTALAYASGPSAAPTPMHDINTATSTSRSDVAAAPEAPAQLKAAAFVLPQCVDRPSAVMPVVNMSELVDEVIHIATKMDEKQAMQQWLQDRQDFWSIAVKQQTGQHVIHRLFQAPQAISSDCLDALLCFFDLDHVLSGINPLALQQLRKRQVTLWKLIPRNHHELALQIRLMSGSSPKFEWVGRDLARLQQPLHWHQVMLAALQPERVSAIGSLIRTILSNGPIEELPPCIDRHHAYFWCRATVTGLFTAPRLAIGAWRAGLVALAGALVTLLFCLSTSTSRIEEPLYSDAWMEAIANSVIVATGLFALWLIYVGIRWFDYWQGLPESMPSKYPWWRRLAIPALCGIGLLVYGISAPPALSALIIFTSLALTIRRVRRRWPSAPIGKASPRIGTVTPAMMFVGLAAANMLSHLQYQEHFNLPFVPATALTTLCIWLFDMWRHRVDMRTQASRTGSYPR